MVEKVVNKSGLVWQIAELLRGSWKAHEYQDVILPLVVLKRLDSVLAPTKEKVLAKKHDMPGGIDPDPILKATSKVGFYNISPYDFSKLLEEPNQAPKNFRNYLKGFSPNIRDIFEKFDFDRQLERLEGGNLLYMILKELEKVDLSPEHMDNHEMGSLFESLIQRFSEQSNETAGEHYTPREVIKLMAELVLSPDHDKLKKKHVIKTVYDCACGTGGMLSVAKDRVLEMNPEADIYLFGQELNPATYAICKSDMLIKGEDPEHIRGGEKDHSKASTLANDQFFGETFDYMLTNPPFGVDWKKDREAVEREHDRGYAGRFGAGLPRISDGQLLFLQHLIFKMRPVRDGGSRIGIVFNGSPLFTGDAGSGESEIRRWILESDWLEAIVAMPDQLFFNTGIYTYIWILSNRKEESRKGKVQLIDARSFYKKMSKSLGNKRHFISDEDRARISRLFDAPKDSEKSKFFATTDFAYRQITVERPLRLNFQASTERLARLGTNDKFLETKPNKKGDAYDPEKILSALAKFGDKLYKNRETFLEDLGKVLEKSGAAVPAPIYKIIWQELSERDETADVCMDNGRVEYDSELRDTENVPWGRDVRDYFKKEVLPYAPDAVLNSLVVDHKDQEVGKVGYEIPFTRHFFTYEPPRPVETIESEILTIEKELLELLKKF
ncbi:MAG: class I SAM-dependent DNA methyltransferase [Patescibacteria group bacterium]|jgi:type I restriction enzyme M protein